jgi:hypothetical protein
MFGFDGPAEQQPGGGGGAGSASGASEGYRHQQLTPCLSQVGANPHHVPFASSACRLDDDDTGKQHCRCHHNFPPSLLHPSSAPLYGPVAVLRKRLRLVDSRQRHFFSSSRTPDARLRAAIATPPKFQTPGLARRTPARSVFQKRAYISTCNPSSFSNLAHVPLQTFLDFNAAYILIE